MSVDRQAGVGGGRRAAAGRAAGSLPPSLPAPTLRSLLPPPLPQVVALGGSITRGTGATSPGAAYISRFFQLLNATFPHRWAGGRLGRGCRGLGVQV